LNGPDRPVWDGCKDCTGSLHEYVNHGNWKVGTVDSNPLVSCGLRCLRHPRRAAIGTCRIFLQTDLSLPLSPSALITASPKQSKLRLLSLVNCPKTH
jgi:hypothetical protein